ncbi:MAG: discoidin domain-containing protein [Chloroflexia bacterium]|nr:discoidin domain-containing protein [Chloroflexia bacterium]
MKKTGIWILLSVFFLVACGQTPAPEPIIQPTAAPAPTAAPTKAPEGPALAREIALDYLAEQYGAQAPGRDLDWQERRITPEGLLGSETYQYTAGDWTLTVHYPVVAPEAVIYRVEVENAAAGFYWQGSVDAQGQLAEIPAGAIMARDAVLDYLSAQYADQAPAQDLRWWGQRTTPEDLLGSETYQFSADGWVMTVQYPVVAPEAVIYRVDVSNVATAFSWQGTVDAAGQVDELDEGDGEVVDGWTGVLVKLPPGSQFGGYFQRDDGERFDFGTQDQAVRELLSTYTWTGAQVRIWGQVYYGVPATEARHVEVERVEALSGPADDPRNLSPFAQLEASSTLPADRSASYGAYNAIDGLLETSWVEGVEGPGVGEWILLTFPGTIEISQFSLDVGYDQDEELFFANNRIKRATVYVSDEQFELEFSDERGLQALAMARTPGGPIETTFVKLVIEEVYPGSRYDDTCLAEIEVWGLVRE